LQAGSSSRARCIEAFAGGDSVNASQFCTSSADQMSIHDEVRLALFVATEAMTPRIEEKICRFYLSKVFYK
jgi:hypothetical protein